MKNKRRKIRNCTKKQANLSSKIAGAIAIISVVLILGILVRENFGMNSLSYNLITGALVGDNSVDLATSDSPAKTLPAEISLAAAPSITSIILNSSTSVNDTAHNLTLWLTGSDADGDAFRNITNWYLNGNSLLLLNLPFEGGSNSTWTRDYGSGNNATVAGAAWNASRGYARFGAYTFEGVNDYLSIPDSNLLDLTSPFTIEFRFMPNQTFNHSADYYQGLLDKGTYQIYLDKSDGKLKFYLDSNATENWSAVGLGMDLDVTSLVVFNGELYAAGAFTTAGGINANYTAKWNGTDWSTLGLGTSSDEGTPNVDALIVYKNELYAGGQFNSAGGLSANKIAKWNGTSWGALGSGMGNGRVLSQAIYRGDLYLGGSFTTAGSVGANRTAKWNNTNWSGLGTGTNNVVNALIVYNGDLYAGGSFTTAGGVGANRTAKWNGTHWSGLGSGMNNIVYSLVLYNGELYAGGMFTTAGSVGANRTAKWNGTDWSVLGSGVNSTVDSLTVNNGELYAGGTFTSAGGLGANYIAKWNGTDWSALGSGTNSSIYSSVVYNGDLYVGGAFTSAGGVSANYSARWSSGAKEIASVTNNFSTTWQHLAITYNQTNLSLYLNGVLENSIITSIIPSTNSLALWLGATYGSSGPGYFNGTIDEVRIYNRSLSSPEITALYQNRTDLIVSNELRAGNIWKACVTPNDLTVDGNESCSNNLTILNTAPSISSLILNTTNLSSNTTAQNLTAYVLTNDIDSDSIKSIYNWYVNGTSITLLNLPFEGRSNSTWTRDYAQGKNGTVVNATWNSTGGYDGKGAYQFNGNNSYISTGSGINLTRGGTIVAWINPRNTLGYQTIVASGHAGGSTSSFNLFVDSGVLRAVFYNGTDFIGQTSGTFNATNQWSQIIWAFNGQTGFLYINKVLQSQTSSFRKSSTYPNTVIGALNTNPATDHFNGSIDEVLIFNRSLSSPEITALYQNRTDLIVSNELAAGDIWKTCVTPNDGTVDGTESCSNNLTVLRTDNCLSP